MGVGELNRNILEGRLEMLLPLANGQIPEQPITLGRLVAMPAQQHLQLQVRLMTIHCVCCWERIPMI